MNEESKICGVAWRYRAPFGGAFPTIKEYNTFLERSDAVLRIVRKGGIVEAEIPLHMVPACDFCCEDDSYVFPMLVRAGDIEKWEAPKEALLRLSVQGEGYFWLEPKAD